MSKIDYKYLPISTTAETLPLDSPEFEKIKQAYVEDVLTVMSGGSYDLQKQAISLQKITMFFASGKTRNRYVVLLLEPTSDPDRPHVPSPHLIVSILTAYELAGKMKITYVDMTEESICLCNQYESDMHLN
jgi:hypothetical protein